jgi:hypothetical protein
MTSASVSLWDGNQPIGTKVDESRFDFVAMTVLPVGGSSRGSRFISATVGRRSAGAFFAAPIFFGELQNLRLRRLPLDLPLISARSPTGVDDEVARQRWFGCLRDGDRGARAGGPLAATAPHGQPFLAIQPIELLVVHGDPFPRQQDAEPAVSDAPALAEELELSWGTGVSLGEPCWEEPS